MRIRSVKPSAFTSLSLANVDRAARWTFIGIVSMCFDDGFLQWDPRLVKAAVYPLDEAITASVVDEDVRALIAVDAVCVYVVDDREYLHVPAFNSHQSPRKPTFSNFPPCPNHPENRTGAQPTPHQYGTSTAPVTHGGEGRGIGEGGEGKIPPPLYCTNHPNGTTTPCGACRTAREHRADYDAQQTRTRNHTAQIADTCPDCRGSNWIEDANGNPLTKCTHPQTRKAAS